MKLKSLKLAPILICLAAIGGACLAQQFLGQARVLRLFQRLEWILYDWRVRVAHRFDAPASDKLGFVFIGDDTIIAVGQGLLNTNIKFGLKWPRDIYGRVVRELKAEGAKEVGLDIFFSDRREDQIRQGFDPDKDFALQLEQAGNVIIGAASDVIPEPLFRRAADGLGDLSPERDSDGVLRRALAFHDYRIWDLLIKYEALLGKWDLASAVVRSNEISFPRPGKPPLVIGLNPDGYFDPTELGQPKPAGGFVRLRKAFEEARVWHLGIVLAARELNLDLEKAEIQLEKGRIVLRATDGAQRIIPVDGRGHFLIEWGLGLKDKRVTKEAFEVLLAHDLKRAQGEPIESRFAGKLVVVGSTATGNDLTDRGATPLEKESFLTSNYWNVVNSVLLGRFIRSSSLGPDFLLIGLMGLGAAGLTLRLPALWASLSVGLLISICALGTMYLFVVHRLLLPMVMPAGASFVAHFGLLVYQTFFEQNERRRIKAIFAKLVSPNVVNELLKADKLSLVPARGQVTIFFADVRGFTELADRSHAEAEAYVHAHQLGAAEAKIFFDQRAQQVLHTVNIYLGLLADIIKRRDGTLDKYIGDCVMAFWGAPVANERHALACVRAAIDAQRAIQNLNQQRAAQNKSREQENVRRTAAGQPPLAMLELLSLGTGINTGVVTVGLMGSDEHGLNYTVFGRDVNLASRLEGYSGRGRIIIGEATYLELRRDDPALAATCAAIQLPPTALKGFGTSLKVYEVPWRAGLPTEFRLKLEQSGATETTSTTN